MKNQIFSADEFASQVAAAQEVEQLTLCIDLCKTLEQGLNKSVNCLRHWLTSGLSQASARRHLGTLIIHPLLCQPMYFFIIHICICMYMRMHMNMNLVSLLR